MEKLKKRKQKNKEREKNYRVLVVCIFVGVLLLSVMLFKPGRKPKEDQESMEEKSLTIEELLEKTASENGFSVEEYPERLINLLKKNPETQEFVLNYPMKKDTYSNENLTELEESDGIPLLIQWDERWGYYLYAGNVMGVTGCGPTCLSMVASYLLDNQELTPIYMADYATRNRHCTEGGGTEWTLMNEGARALGLNAREVPLDENEVRKHLEDGRPIICNVGEGVFTDNGHYLVFAGWEDGKIKINDPNNKSFSNRLWEFEEIQDQIKNMWVY